MAKSLLALVVLLLSTFSFHAQGEAPACNDPSESSEPAGFYRTDAWPKGEIALTFDDGPHIARTPKVLDQLAKHRFRATFFLVGRGINSRTYRLVQRIVAEGHVIGSHSYDHDVTMASRLRGERGVEYVRGEHETTRTLIDLALVAKSPEDFDQMFTRVFERKPFTLLSTRAIERDWRHFSENAAVLLSERGYPDGAHPYTILFSRPPGGGPFLGKDDPARRIYGRALGELGFINVMWNAAAGDTDALRRKDLGYLLGNLSFASHHGGVVLLHDGIRSDALGAALDAMAKDPSIRVVPLEQAVERKFGCSALALANSIVPEAKSAKLASR